MLNEVRATNISISGSVSKEKAIETVAKQEIKRFTASNGWIDRF